ncbi:MAG: response regulator [Pseudomonadota bacterium]|nr:response regulator [Pseudomonadota bacterium]
MDILLVEDNKSDAFLLKELFAKKSNAPEIHWVVDGYDALDYVFRRKQYQDAPRPDVILLDLKLPRISGYEVLKQIKSVPGYADIPVVILTTSLNPLDHTQCKALGADICLSKPYGLKDYESMVQRLMSWAALRVLDEAMMTSGVAH